MGLEYQMEDVEIKGGEDRINELLRLQWEPFAVDRGKVWFRRMFHNEDREPASSTKPENMNWMGNEPDVEEEDE